MHLFWYDHEPNFGDALSPWLVSRLFPTDLVSVGNNDDTRLLFVGSILYDFHPANMIKVVLGAGYGGYEPAPAIDGSWQLYALRGPLSAKALGVEERLGVGDAAILLKGLVPPADRRSGVSFIPHFETLKRGNWAKVCESAGVRLIDPRWPVDDVLAAIASSEMTLCEAMHGAIVSDVLRTPWVPLKPFDPKHWMKWSDWAMPLGINLNFRTLPPSTMAELFVRSKGRDSWKLFHREGWQAHAAKAAEPVLLHRATAALMAAKAWTPTLSSDAALNSSFEQLRGALDRVIRDGGDGLLRDTSREPQPSRLAS